MGRPRAVDHARSDRRRALGSAAGVASDRRAEILDFAARRFAESGFDATSMRQIAEDADILSGSLYHHFVNKDAMLHEVVRDALVRLRDNTLRIARTPVDAEHRVAALVLLELGERMRAPTVHAILSNEQKLFLRREEFAYVVQATNDIHLAWRAVLQDGAAARVFKPDLDIHLMITTTLRMLDLAADWYSNDDAAVAGPSDAYTLDRVIDFYLGYVLSAVRLPSRAAASIPRAAGEELARVGRASSRDQG
jgi:AcrR family transcriptional regulator